VFATLDPTHVRVVDTCSVGTRLLHCFIIAFVRQHLRDLLGRAQEALQAAVPVIPDPQEALLLQDIFLLLDDIKDYWMDNPDE
jgi:hypothetical protein